jgi:ribonuclease P protein component
VRSREIERVLHGGRSFHGSRVVIFMAPGTDRCAVIAGRKVGGAVERNRARRVLRAAWPSVASLARGSDTVLVARAGILHAKTQELVEEMRDVLQGSTVR